MRRSTWALVAVSLAGCAATSASRWDHPVVTAALPSAGPVFVMEPVIVGPASPGNVGRDFNAISNAVASRILSVVRERFPRAEMADSRPVTGARVPGGYPIATAEPPVTARELNAASRAFQDGATHLLVPTITEWREMRADDPIGALTVPHNSITVTLRLMRLDPPALVGRVTFSNHARLTTNARATHLLNDEFRQVVLRLVGGTT